MPEEFILDVTPEEFEKAGSKFASPGLHLSEMGLPEWKTEGQSIKFPFIIIEEGDENGKDGELVAGISASAAWKLKEILAAIGVEAKESANGRVAFKSNDCVGKQFKALYIEQVDTRKPEEGGKGTRYTKATTAYPVDTTSEDLGI